MTEPVDLERLQEMYSDLVEGRSFGVEWLYATEAAWPAILAELTEGRKEPQWNQRQWEESQDVARYETARNSVRIGPHGEFVIIPEDPHDDERIKALFDDSLDAIRAAIAADQRSTAHTDGDSHDQASPSVSKSRP